MSGGGGRLIDRKIWEVWLIQPGEMCLLLSRKEGGASFKRGAYIRDRNLTVEGGGGGGARLAV